MTEHLTERQKKWFASLREGLERETGKSLEDWVAIAQTCPETKPRAQLGWLKAFHSLGQNRASYVLSVSLPVRAHDLGQARRSARGAVD
jgi:hypothetical protein